MLVSYNDIQIEVNGTKKQLARLEGATLEANPHDANCLRFILKDGTKGQWFSRLWPMPLDAKKQVLPHEQDMSEQAASQWERKQLGC